MDIQGSSGLSLVTDVISTKITCVGLNSFVY